MITYYLKKIWELPPDVVFKKAAKKIALIFQNKLERYKYYSKNLDLPFLEKELKSFIDINKLDISGIDKKVAEYHIKMYLSHRFDLLGSGWVKNTYDSKPLGLEGYKYDMNVEFDLEKLLKPAHVKRAKEIWELVDKDYIPIDWQKDYKSGYRWSARDWYKDTRKVIGRALGADIKVPWELARMQHLPQLAVFSLVCPEHKEKSIREFKNQVLDFIATNPPKMGVNWACTMDVAIRAANMLIAYDMFDQLDTNNILDNKFKQIFANSVYEHGFHIINNLEYNEFLTSNHYLSDIVGLLFVGAYLDNGEWISYAVQEIIKEMKKEFYEDGGNFESSTSYHRLSGELMVYATALIVRLLQENKIKKIDYKIKNQKFKLIRNQQTLITHLPQWYIDRLYKIGRFTVDITKPNGDIPQFGDNDSGRFFRFSPNGDFLSNKEAEDKYLNLKGYNELIREYGDTKDDLYWDENILNHQTFISAINGLFDDDIFQTDFRFEKSFTKILANSKTLHPQDQAYQTIRTRALTIDVDLTYIKEIKYTLPFNAQNESYNIFTYPDSGIIILKNAKFYLAICATPPGQNNNGGHTHNDKLSYELWIDGKDIAKDPGTYLYTPLPHRRNEFRSTKAHNVPMIDNLEQNSWSECSAGLFSMFIESELIIENFNKNFIKFVLRYKDVIVARSFLFKDNLLLIVDKSNNNLFYNSFKQYSNGYGKLDCITLKDVYDNLAAS